MKEVIDEVHNSLANPRVPGVFMQEQMAVANLALHSLVGIDENSRETLEAISQESAMGFEVAMTTAG